MAAILNLSITVLQKDSEAGMKIAVSGSHRTGKTELVGELTEQLSTYTAVDEPYNLLIEEGHTFPEMPALEDFELQLDQSIKIILESNGDFIFDHCPYDILAYLITHEDSVGFDIKRWIPKVSAAMGQIDLLVFVPIENPDRITLTEHRRLRISVNEELQDIVLADRWNLGVNTIEVTGSVSHRVQQVLAAVSRG